MFGNKHFVEAKKDFQKLIASPTCVFKTECDIESEHTSSVSRLAIRSAYCDCITSNVQSKRLMMSPSCWLTTSETS